MPPRCCALIASLFPLWVAALCAVALTGCEREGPSAGMQTYTVLADEVCTCSDTECVENVMAHGRWKAMKEVPTFRTDEAKAATALQERINGCLKATSHGSGSRPHSEMHISLPSPN